MPGSSAKAPSEGRASVHENFVGLPGMFFKGRGEQSKFTRFYSWSIRAQSILPVRTGGFGNLFPCQLPFPDVVEGKCRSRRLDKRMLWWNKQFVNSLFAYYNFLTLGCPAAAADYEPQSGFAPRAEILPSALRLLGEIGSFCSLEIQEFSHKVSGGRAELEKLIEAFPCAESGYFVSKEPFLTSKATSALTVQSERIAIPNVAGTVKILDHLPPERARVIRDLEQLRMPEFLWNRIPVACHQVPALEEDAVARKLLTAQMAVLLPESELPRDRKGRLLPGGLFSVPKNDSEDRLIFDRRPENETMQRLSWARLPSGACFTRMLLRANEYVRGSGEDLRNFYYNLALPTNWCRYNSFGRRVSRQLLLEYGLDPQQHYRLCFRVLGMGDRNACCIAQAVHEHILKEHGLLKDKHLLQYGRAPPRSSRWEGVYLDDLLVTQVCRTPDGSPVNSEFIPPPPSEDDPDMIAVKRAHEAYQQAGLQRAEHKGFKGKSEFRAWGAEVHGIKGTVGAPLQSRRDLWILIGAIVRTGFVTKNILQRLLGHISFAFQYRREFYGLLHRSFSYVEQMAEDTWVKLAGDIADELRAVALHLPITYWNMRREISNVLNATDATPSSGGSTVAAISSKLGSELFRRSEHRGEHVHLDPDYRNDASADKLDAAKCTAEINTLGTCLDWKTTSSYRFRQTSHVNLQELRAIKNLVKSWAITTAQHQKVHLILTDSQVCLGCVSKGRSSSYKLNGILRSMIPYLVAGDIAIALNYINTKYNPADHPSRFVPIPPPQPMPTWVKKYGMKDAYGAGLEVFAGSGRLTRAHRMRGLAMLDPVDVLWNKDAFSPDIDHNILMGCCSWLWLAPPCSSFSPLRNLDKGGPLRPAGDPVGDENNPVIRKGNRLWARALELAELMHTKGGYFTIEHPRNSRAWQLSSTQRLKSKCGARFVSVDWCQYRSPTDMLNRKATRLLTTCPWINSLWCKTCCGDHNHGRPLRGARAAAAAAYPVQFCNEVASQCLKWYNGKAKDLGAFSGISA